MWWGSGEPQTLAPCRSEWHPPPPTPRLGWGQWFRERRGPRTGGNRKAGAAKMHDARLQAAWLGGAVGRSGRWGLREVSGTQMIRGIWGSETGLRVLGREEQGTTEERGMWGGPGEVKCVQGPLPLPTAPPLPTYPHP